MEGGVDECIPESMPSPCFPKSVTSDIVLGQRNTQQEMQVTLGDACAPRGKSARTSDGELTGGAGMRKESNDVGK